MANKTPSNKLTELYDLYKTGAISKEQFDLLKSSIIDQDEAEIEQIQIVGNPNIDKQGSLALDTATCNALKKTKTILGVIIFSLLTLVIIFATLWLLSSKDDNIELNKETLSAEKEIAQLTSNLIVKSDSINSLKGILRSINDSMMVSKSIPIPVEIQRKIDALNELQKNKIPLDAKFYSIGNGQKYELRFTDDCDGLGEIVYSINDINTAVWQYETPECGSGNNSSEGSILFGQVIVEMYQFTSCAGASDCAEYVGVLANSNSVYSKRIVISTSKE